MKFNKQIIYCVEGVWDYENEVEPSVEPMLEQLRRMGRWDYMRRDCATINELQFYLETEWSKCYSGSILYIAAHGEEGKIWLSDNQPLGLSTLQDYVRDLRGCLIHFGCCSVMKAPSDVLKDLIFHTEAMGIFGYNVDTGWTGTWAPALALELMYFNSIAEEKINLENGKHFQRLNKIVLNLKDRFRDCEFELKTRLDFK